MRRKIAFCNLRSCRIRARKILAIVDKVDGDGKNDQCIVLAGSIQSVAGSEMTVDCFEVTIVQN